MNYLGSFFGNSNSSTSFKSEESIPVVESPLPEPQRQVTFEREFFMDIPIDREKAWKEDKDVQKMWNLCFFDQTGSETQNLEDWMYKMKYSPNQSEQIRFAVHHDGKHIERTVRVKPYIPPKGVNVLNILGMKEEDCYYETVIQSCDSNAMVEISRKLESGIQLQGSIVFTLNPTFVKINCRVFIFNTSWFTSSLLSASGLILETILRNQITDFYSKLFIYSRDYMQGEMIERK